MDITLTLHTMLHWSISNLLLLCTFETQNMFRYSTVFTNTSAVSCVYKSNVPIVLFDRQKNHQPMNRSYDAYICSSYSRRYHTPPRMCNCCFDFAFNRHIYDDNASAVKISPCGFAALRHSDRYSYCIRHISHSKLILTKLCSIRGIVYVSE